MQRDSESGADQEIVDVILSGKVCTARVLLSTPSLPLRGALFLTSLFQTEAHLQPAWGNYEFSGRVRVSDGLVVLVRQPVGQRRAVCTCHWSFLTDPCFQLNAQGGKLSGGTIYAGYGAFQPLRVETSRADRCLSRVPFTVLSSQNFVGKWKYCSPGAAQWEGVWSLCKAE